MLTVDGLVEYDSLEQFIWAEPLALTVRPVMVIGNIFGKPPFKMLE